MAIIADLRFAFLASVMALVLAPAAEADTAQVEILDFGFVPDEITIAAVGEMQWTNTGAAIHTVRADEGSGGDFDSGTMRRGDGFSRLFQNTGTYGYHCEVHPSMKGSVRVVPAGTSSTATATPTIRPATTTTSMTTRAPSGGAPPAPLRKVMGSRPQRQSPSPAATTPSGKSLTISGSAEVAASPDPPRIPVPPPPTPRSILTPSDPSLTPPREDPIVERQKDGVEQANDDDSAGPSLGEISSKGQTPGATVDRKLAALGTALLATSGWWFLRQLRPRRR